MTAMAVRVSKNYAVKPGPRSEEMEHYTLKDVPAHI